ncbi:MAG: chromate efflux transporter [Polyangiaceae bacterium]|jgi:chromate transporter
MMNDGAVVAKMGGRARLYEVALLFLRLGLTAFGGPAAHIAMMEDEVVRRRRWVSSERFLDLMSAASLIPGPSSSELALFLGCEQAGALGLLVAGACFIFPAAAMTTGIAWAYVRFGSLPHAASVLYGIKPVVIAIVFQAIWGLAPKALKRSRWLAGLAAVACIASWAGVDALVVLVGTGLVSAVRHFPHARRGAGATRWLALGSVAATSAVASPASVGLSGLFLTFVKVGAVVFGSGYVLLAFLRADIVERLHWLSESQLIDAVAVGQVTPGPVFTTATFIGYVLAGVPGAVVSTVAIFLPGFVFVAAARPVVARVRRFGLASAFLDGVNVASLALMAVVTLHLARAALIDPVTLALALASAGLLVRFRLNSTWLIAAGALAGLASRGLQ